MAKRRKPHHPDAPLLYPDHARPVSRRDFIRQGLLAGAGMVMAPPLLGLLGGTRNAYALAAEDWDLARAIFGMYMVRVDAQIPDPPPTYAPGRYRVINPAGLNIRTQPGIGGTVVGSMPADWGVVVEEVLQQGPDVWARSGRHWCAIVYGGRAFMEPMATYTRLLWLPMVSK